MRYSHYEHDFVGHSYVEVPQGFVCLLSNRKQGATSSGIGKGTNLCCQYSIKVPSDFERLARPHVLTKGEGRMVFLQGRDCKDLCAELKTSN